ncbi:uncharacterized protein [Dermacentor andersoni]|uniref:uncharacterized protein n=1 Tax=Dermacentor andersoni TaxID=34620 RepID=UPI003B3A8530
MPLSMPNDTTGQCSSLSNEYPKSCFPSYNGTFKYKRQRPGEQTINGTSHSVADGGSFYLEAHNMSLDPPLKPWKFRACCERPGTNGTLLLVMSWNWAGAHLNFGKASSIDIRVSNESESLKQHFESQEKIDSTNLVEGTLEPGEARTRNVVTISLPGEWAEVTEKYTRWNLKFAARTTNSLNVTSELSDIADIDYIIDNKYTSEATVSVPAGITAAEESSPISTGGNTAEYNDEMNKSTTEDSDDGQMYTSKASRREPTSDPETPKGSTESTGGHSDEDKGSDDGTASTYSTPLVLGLLVAAVAVVPAGLWALKRIKDQYQ